MIASKGCSHIMRGLAGALEASGAEVDVAASSACMLLVLLLEVVTALSIEAPGIT